MVGHRSVVVGVGPTAEWLDGHVGAAHCWCCFFLLRWHGVIDGRRSSFLLMFCTFAYTARELRAALRLSDRTVGAGGLHCY